MNGYSLVGEEQHAQKNKRRKQNRLFKDEAQATMLSGDNYYKTVIAHLICALVSGFFFYAAYAVAEYGSAYGIGRMSEQAVFIFTTCAAVILCLIGGFLMFSFFLGAYTLASSMNSEQAPDGSEKLSSLSVMLYPLSSMRGFRKTFAVYIILTAELFVCVAPTVFVFSYLSETGLPGGVAFFIKTLTVFCSAFVGLFFVFLLLPYPFIERNSPDASPFRLYAESAKAALCDIWLGYSMFLSFLPLLLLSFISFFVLYFAYTMPYMTHSMAKIGEYLYKLSITERNDIYET